MFEQSGRESAGVEGLDVLLLVPAAERLASVAGAPPGPEIGRLLASVDPGQLTAAECLDLVAAWERQEAWTAAQKARATAALVDGCSSETRFTPEQLASAELSAALGVSPRTADRNLSEA